MTQLTGSPIELMRLPNRTTAVNIVAMLMRPTKIALNLLLSLSSALLMFGCSGSKQAAPEPPIEAADESALEGADLPNMDELESESSAHIFSSEEERARDLSALWIQHAERLSITSPNGSLAAYLRAAHTSLSALASESCADPFNELCAELRVTYEQALAASVTALKASAWSPPNLAPTRYRLALDTQPASVSLSSLSVELSSTAGSARGRRSGVGTEAVGCASPRREISAGRAIQSCAPLTFVLSFNAPLRSEKITATLTAYDASQSAVVDLHGRELSLAADFGSSLDQLAARVASDRERRLFCVGTPRGSETTLIAAAHQSSVVTVRDMLLTVLLDPELEEHHSVCIFPLRSGESADRAARAMASAARSIADEQAVRPLVPSAATIFLVAEGDDGNKAAAALLSRLKRSSRPRQRLRGAAPIRVQGVYSLASARQLNAPSPELLARLESEAALHGVTVSGPAFDGKPRTRAEQYREIRDQLALPPEFSPKTPPASNSPTNDELEPLKLSPVY